MGKIILNLAISIDGYIADENGGFDWIKGKESEMKTKEVFDFEKFIKEIDVIVMGSKAYEDTPEDSLILY